MPFGDGQVTAGSCGDPSPNHFTGKERASETGLDYFGARYYSNGLGRFITPDWSQVIVPVPYANLGDPQTLNQYSYVRRLPTTKADLDGHGFWEKLKNWVGDAQCWCDETGAQQAIQNRIQNERNWLINNVAQNSSQADALRGASDKQIQGIYGQWKSAIFQAQSGNELIHDISEFQRSESGALVLYRGGSSRERKSGEYKVDAEGNVKTTRGVSVNTDAAKVERFGGADEIKFMPPELQAIQHGADGGHFEIVPRKPMSVGRYLELLRDVVVEAVKEPKE